MKTLKQCLGVLVLVLGLCGMSWATTIDHTDTMTFTSGNVLEGTGTFTWTHQMPDGFSIPPYTVTGSSLVITSRRATDNNDYIHIVDFGTFSDALNNDHGNSAETTTFYLDELGVFSTVWALGQNLNLYLDYDQGTGSQNRLTMVSSVFRLTYEMDESTIPTIPIIPGDPDFAPVPEPGTLLLLGGGLAGLALYRRKQKKCK